MTQTTIGTIEGLLESAIEESDDHDVTFKLRQALQLLVVVNEQQIEAQDTLEDADLTEEVRENLQELGYIGK